MTSVLFVRLSAMGDLVQGLGAIQALHHARPDWRLSLVTQAANVPLLAGVSALTEVFPFDRRGGLRAVRALRATLRPRRFEHALDLQGNWKSAFVARCSGARQTIGAAAAARQEPGSRWLLQRTVDIGGVAHPARVAWQLVRELAPEVPFALPRLVASESEVEAEAEVLRGVGVAPDRAFRVVVVTDPADCRALRPQVVAGEAQRGPEPAVLLVGPGESHLELPQGVPVLRHGAGELRRLVALGVLMARVGGEVLGPDQGASHVLAAAGARTVLQFGAQDPRRTCPPAAIAIVHPQGPPCRPCSRRRCDHPQGPVCMEFAPGLGLPADCGLPADGAARDAGA
ncbi:MAG: glycosyltransferase family 9 protein [Planctomycetes bacterium]|nr:glycosyltransferase family 9 protein [Planctomycetota bacterium]MCB9886501.1 glycosyltransferase family 9 protein [Planctomycetota bacterium]